MARTYRSPAREEAAEKTRVRLVEAALDLFLESDDDDDGGLGHKEVAARAGVSLRTAYNHFPSREALLEAVDGAMADRLGRGDVDDASDLFEAVAKLYEFFERNTSALRALRSRRASRELREHRRSRARQRVEAWAAEQLPGASRAERRQLSALAYLFMNSETWLNLHETLGLNAKEATALAHEVLTAELRRRKRRARR